MSDNLIVGLDAGTSLIKFVAFTLDGKVVNSAAVENKVYYRPGSKAEQNLDETWSKVLESFKKLQEKIPNLKDRIVGLSITGQGDGSWPIDNQANPVGDAALWLDGRAGDIIDDWRNSSVGPNFTSITHTGLNPSMQTGQMFHMLHHEKERFEKVDKVLRCKDWIFHKMTGEIKTEISEAIMTWGSPQTRQYDDEVLNVLNFKQMKKLQPDIIDSTQHVGKLSATAAKLLNLNEGTPIILAPVDVVCSGIGSGFVDSSKKIGCTVLGTAGIHIFVDFDHKKVDPNKQLGYTMPLAGSKANAKMVSNMVASLNTDWLIEIYSSIGQGLGIKNINKSDILKLFEEGASQSKPANVFYYPFISPNGERGPFVNAKARAQYLGLNTMTTSHDLVRALYESLGYACKDCYVEFGAELNLLRLTGGASNSPIVRKIVGAITKNNTQVINNSEQGAAGACMVAMLALKHSEKYDDLNDNWVKPYLQTEEQFDHELSHVYEKAFEVYKSGYQSMKQFWNQNHNLQEGK
jgi:erythritol kinase